LKINSKILVAIQFLSIGVILFPKNSVNIFYYWWVLVLVSAISAIWIFTHNRVGNFNIVPEIKDGASLVVSGPYRYVRHPMYSSLILGVLGVVMYHFCFINLFSLFIMVFALYLKATKEERLWLSHHSEYEDYMKKTKMIIPFIL
jgi:protein-S-isoprenylcysteine O-methyltransferase Ste14